MMRNAYKMLMGKPEWKKTFVRPRSRRKGNIKTESGVRFF
jgi:hypothetical protein